MTSNQLLTKYNLVEIEDIHIEQYTGPVYDLEVGGEFGDHSYNIDGIIVHNSVCTTRIKTGVGNPQLSTIIECADAAHGVGGLICGDGGCTNPGDIAKAFSAGADFVMLGGMLAGHDESGGEIVTKRFLTNEIDIDGKQIIEEKKYKMFYGMSSDTAMKKYYNGVAEYRASEGKTGLVPYRGSVENTVFDILGGLRSTCTYIGAKNIKDMSKCATFVRVTQQSNEIFGKN